MSTPEPVITEADWQTVLEVGALALHQPDHDAGCPRHEHADRLEGCRTITEDVLGAALPVIWRMATAGTELHELVFTDREARPAKWETRCGRTDAPLENAGSAEPGMHYPVTCKACQRIAGLEAALKRFEHLEESAVALAVRRRIDEAVEAEREHICKLAERRGAIYPAYRKPGGDPAATAEYVEAMPFADLIRMSAAADEMSRLGEEIQGGETCLP